MQALLHAGALAVVCLRHHPDSHQDKQDGCQDTGGCMKQHMQQDGGPPLALTAAQEAGLPHVFRHLLAGLLGGAVITDALLAAEREVEGGVCEGLLACHTPECLLTHKSAQPVL
jgi:hypothetical protein